MAVGISSDAFGVTYEFVYKGCSAVPDAFYVSMVGVAFRDGCEVDTPGSLFSPMYMSSLSLARKAESSNFFVSEVSPRCDELYPRIDPCIS